MGNLEIHCVSVHVSQSPTLLYQLAKLMRWPTIVNFQLNARIISQVKSFLLTLLYDYIYEKEIDALALWCVANTFSKDDRIVILKKSYTSMVTLVRCKSSP